MFRCIQKRFLRAALSVKAVSQRCTFTAAFLKLPGASASHELQPAFAMVGLRGLDALRSVVQPAFLSYPTARTHAAPLKWHKFKHLVPAKKQKTSKNLFVKKPIMLEAAFRSALLTILNLSAVSHKARSERQLTLAHFKPKVRRALTVNADFFKNKNSLKCKKTKLISRKKKCKKRPTRIDGRKGSKTKKGRSKDE